jgi:hypothetical protein
MNAHHKTIMNANLFSRLFDGLDDPNRVAIETIDGARISYGELISRAGTDGECAGWSRRQARRPCCRPN